MVSPPVARGLHLHTYVPLAGDVRHSLSDLQADGTDKGASKRARMDGGEANSFHRYGTEVHA